MDLKKKLNLNNYEFWKNHKRVITYGGFLIAFSVYTNPIIQHSKEAAEDLANKNHCVRIAAKNWFNQSIPENQKKKNPIFEGFPAKQVARAQAYKRCS